MTPKNRGRASPPGPYILELDEGLLAEAVAAVESHRPRREAPVGEVEIEIPEPKARAAPPEADPPTVSNLDHGIAPPEEEESTSEPGLDLATMAAEWARVNAEMEKLKAELGKLRTERDAAALRAESENRERVRLAGRVKRLNEAAAESFQAAQGAREAQRVAEAALTKAQQAATAAEDGIGRLRERLRRQEDEQRLYGHTPTVVELLPILENLERATHTRDSSLSTLRDGVKIVHDQFRIALSRVGVARIEASRGVMFQPAIHEAVIHVAVADALPGTVVAELQPGYMLNGRLLRPARVSVAAATGAGAYEAPPPVAPARPSLSEGDALALPDDGSFEVDDSADEDEETSLDA